MSNLSDSLQLPAAVAASGCDIILGNIITSLSQFASGTGGAGAVISFDLILAVCQNIDSRIEDWKDDTEIEKIKQALYNPKILNKLIGQALNFGSEEEVVEKIDSFFDVDFSSIPFLSWIDRVWDNTEGSSIPQDHYNFHNIIKFHDITGEADLWLSQEMKLFDLKWGVF